MTTTDQQLPPSSILVKLEYERAERYRLAVLGLCAELTRVQEQRDALRAAVDRALQDLQNGWPEAALDVLARAQDENARSAAGVTQIGCKIAT